MNSYWVLTDCSVTDELTIINYDIDEIHEETRIAIDVPGIYIN